MNEIQSSISHLPGLAELIGADFSVNLGSNKKTAMPAIFLITGASGTGKTLFCRQFLLNALRHDNYCIFLSAGLIDQQFSMMFPSDLSQKIMALSKFINPFLGIGFGSGDVHDNNIDDNPHSNQRLSLTIREIRRLLLSNRSQVTRVNENLRYRTDFPPSRPCVLVIDSLTEFLLLFDEAAVLRFISELCMTLRQFAITAVFTLTAVPPTPSTAEATLQTFTSSPAGSSLSSMRSILASIVDGVLEVKLDDGRGANDAKGSRYNGESESSSARSIRLLSMKGLYRKPKSVPFTITDDGLLVFGFNSNGSLKCTLCGKPITTAPIMESEFPFDAVDCVETYKRLVGAYGSSLPEMGGLASHVQNMNFFFVDIVGLSNPAQSVKNQIEKIELLNRLIGSCETFSKTKEPKIVLPTGDGMAIGFYNNPESPLRLSIELHRKLNEYNNRYRRNSHIDSKGNDVRGENGASSSTEMNSSLVSQDGADEAMKYLPADSRVIEQIATDLGIRIGLSSGPVFIVNDIMGNQNVWGPGIILARRVMDIGDNMHILLSESTADSLVSLRDEYRDVIKLVGEYQIKHGQKINVYLAYSNYFGNPNPPAKLSHVSNPTPGTP